MSTQSKALLTFGTAICLIAAGRTLASGSAKTLGLTQQQAAILLTVGVTLSPVVTRAIR